MIQNFVRERRHNGEFGACLDEEACDNGLVVISLPVSEWRQATGLHNLAMDCIETNWMGDNRGMKHKDVCIWFRISLDQAQQTDALDVPAIQV